MRKPAVFVLIVLLFATVAFGSEISPARAADSARDLLQKAIRVGSDEIFPKQDLRDATLGEVLTVHHPVTLEPAYGIVPVRNSQGRLIGIVGVDAAGDSWLWCTFNYPYPEFPVVSAVSASNRLRARRQTMGLEGQVGIPMLIEGCDKHIYWHVKDSAGEAWLIDAVLEDAPILTSDEASARRALTPEKAAYKHVDPDRRNREQSAPSDFALLAETPAAYNIPGVPYHFQITSWYCGPASLQMVMDYWGEEVDQDDIADVANDIVDYGTYSDDMRRAAHFSGMSTCIQNPSLQGYNERKPGYACTETNFMSNPAQKLKNAVYAQYPVFILTWFGPTHSAGHYRVVKGWDDSLGVFILHDPWYYGTLCGPDLVMSETLLIDDLWVYSGYWAMIACPWETTPTVPASASVGDTFSVDLHVCYPAPSRFGGQYNCTGCKATIALPAGLSLAGGSATQSLPNMDSGDTTVVSWDVIAQAVGDFSLAFQAQGTMTGSSGSYPSYSDTIGGHAAETITVGSTLLAGWSSEEQLTSGDGSSLLCSPGARAMIVGTNGDVHLVWADTQDGTNDIYYMKNSGGTWGTPTRLSDQPGFSTTPCIAEGLDGMLHVAWVDGRNGNHEIYYRRWDPAGGWSAEERVTNDGEVDYCPAIAAGDTAVYLAWERRMGGGFRVSAVHFSERTSLGWSVPVDVDASSARDSYRPSLAYGPDRILYLAYERQTSNDPNEHERVVMKSWDGAAWSARTSISSEVGFSRNPCIAVGPDTTLHVVWQDGENVYGTIYYAYYDGSAWQPYVQVSPAGVEATTPSVAVGSSGTAHIVWSDHRHVDTEIYYSKWDDFTFGGESRLSKASGHSTVPAVAAGEAGKLCVVWCDLRNGNADLYFRATDGQSGLPAGESIAGLGGGVRLAVPSPNPFAGATRIDFVLSREVQAKVEVFDVEGRLVMTLADGEYTAGRHSLTWDGRAGESGKVSAGVYFIRCKTPIGTDVKRVVVAR